MEFHAAATSDAIARSYVRRAPERGVLHRTVRKPTHRSCIATMGPLGRLSIRVEYRDSAVVLCPLMYVTYRILAQA